MTELVDLPACICGRTLMEKNGVTWCPSEDGVQKIETEFNPNASADAEDINPWETVGLPRQKTVFDYAHDSVHQRRMKEWYGE